MRVISACTSRSTRRTSAARRVSWAASTSSWPRITVSGVRSSCEASATNSRWLANASARRSSMWLNASARTAPRRRGRREMLHPRREVAGVDARGDRGHPPQRRANPGAGEVRREQRERAGRRRPPITNARAMPCCARSTSASGSPAPAIDLRGPELGTCRSSIRTADVGRPAWSSSRGAARASCGPRAFSRACSPASRRPRGGRRRTPRGGCSPGGTGDRARTAASRWRVNGCGADVALPPRRRSVPALLPLDERPATASSWVVSPRCRGRSRPQLRAGVG